MGEIGGIEVQKALHNRKGTHVIAPTYSPTKLRDFEDLMLKLVANALPDNIFRPRIVAMSTLGDASPTAMSLTSVEVLRCSPLTLDPRPRSAMICALTYLDTAEECARIANTLQDKARPSKSFVDGTGRSVSGLY